MFFVAKKVIHGIINHRNKCDVEMRRKGMYDPRPNKCPDCNGNVVYGKMTDFGLKSFQSGKCYYCTNCGAYVGTHQNRPKEALGRLADGKTRHMRMMCHKEFDKHWESTVVMNRLYYRLSKELGMKKEDCHFGYMDYEQLNHAYQIMLNWENFIFR